MFVKVTSIGDDVFYLNLLGVQCLFWNEDRQYTQVALPGENILHIKEKPEDILKYPVPWVNNQMDNH